MTRRAIWRWLVLAALMLGLALSIKHLALIVAGIATATLLVREWRRGWSLSGAAQLRRCSRRSRRRFRPSGTAAPMSPREILFFPSSIAYSVPGRRIDGADVSQQMLVELNAHYGRPRSFRTLALLPWDMTVHAAFYGGTLGPAFLVLIPALVFLRRRPPAPAVAVVGVGRAAYLALWASPLSSFQMRFVIPIVPLLAARPEGASRLAGDASRARMVVLSAVALLLIMNLPPAVEWHERDRAGWDHWLDTRHPRRACGGCVRR